MTLFAPKMAPDGASLWGSFGGHGGSKIEKKIYRPKWSKNGPKWLQNLFWQCISAFFDGFPLAFWRGASKPVGHMGLTRPKNCPKCRPNTTRPLQICKNMGKIVKMMERKGFPTISDHFGTFRDKKFFSHFLTPGPPKYHPRLTCPRVPTKSSASLWELKNSPIGLKCGAKLFSRCPEPFPFIWDCLRWSEVVWLVCCFCKPGNWRNKGNKWPSWGEIRARWIKMGRKCCKYSELVHK